MFPRIASLMSASFGFGFCSRSAVALRNLQVDPRGLHGFRRFALDAFDRGDVLACHGGERRYAGARRLAFNVHGAGATLRDAASIFRTV
jgi:hypothetical protein